MVVSGGAQDYESQAARVWEVADDDADEVLPSVDQLDDEARALIASKVWHQDGALRAKYEAAS